MVRADPPADALAGQGGESRFLTANDGVRLHYLCWFSGRSPPWAAVIFLHGIASHGGWFGETATDLNHQGVAVYAPDRRGSGRSGGPRGHLDRYERALDDVEEVVRLVSSEHVGTPLFLAASSWAAKLALVYASLRPAPLSGLLLLGPGLLPRGQSLTRTTGSSHRWASGHPDGSPPHSADPRAVHGQPSLRRPHPNRSAPAPRGHGPVLLGDGTAGPPAPAWLWPPAPSPARPPRSGRQDDGRTQDASLVRPARRRGQDLLAYPGAGHTLDFEPDRSRYPADMLGWLSARVSSGSPRSTGGGP